MSYHDNLKFVFLMSKLFLSYYYSKEDISWARCIGFAGDNCNTMIGAKNSVLTRVRERQPNVFNIGCICHLADLCAAAGVKQLSVPVDDFLFDIHFQIDRRYVMVSAEI